MSINAFNRYAYFIQEYIYQKKWEDLREVQIEACDAIMDTDKNVLIASGTASGKTEAAFFPILTLLDDNPSKSIGIMYISPLKALINNQFERLNELLEKAEIPVWSWHGDISQSHKKKALKTAKGILQITPESLEALIMTHPGDVYRLFSDLRFIIIDEIHAFMGEDRGMQVICLISRLEKMTDCHPRRIGLSATLNDYQPAMDFLSAGSDKDTISVGIKDYKRTISLCVKSFIIPESEESVKKVVNGYNNFLYNNCHNKKCLIFTNSRSESEKTIKELKNIAKQRRENDVFFVHHGSVSASLRKETENILKNNEGPTVVAATLTLELGIDIGDLDLTIQIGAPFTCSSFVQRLGRSGRRTGKSQMMFLNLYDNSNKESLEALPWDLLRSIAIIQLYLEDKWVEPFKQKKKPYSLLAHQTLSILMTDGELTPVELARKVLLLPAFKDKISLDEYKKLLKNMIQKDYLQRMDNGSIIIGLVGEKICNYYSFYTVFQSRKEYKVIDKNGEIGTIDRCPADGEIFSLAGRSWVTVAIDHKKMKIYVNHANNSKIIKWYGSDVGDIHSTIIQQIKKILEEDTMYPYLVNDAKEVLCNARKLAKDSGILTYDVIKYDEKSYYICPWTGTKNIKTMVRLLSKGFNELLDIREVKYENYYLSFTTGLEQSTLIRNFQNINCDINDVSLVLKNDEAPQIDKYDYMVPKELLRIAYLNNQLNIPETLEIIKNLKWR